MTTPNHTIGDALLYAAALAEETIPWVTDTIIDRPSPSDASAEVAENAANALGDLKDKLSDLADAHGLSDSYSDGRPLWTYVELDKGVGYSHLWKPDPTKDVPHTIHPTLNRGRRVKIHVLPPSTVTVEVIGTIAAVPDPDN